MYTAEEQDSIADDMRQALAAEVTDSPATRHECDAAFQARVRSNLHIVLCFSPVGGRLRQRCRTFPALVNNCTIDWFSPWPAAALHSVAVRYLSQLGDLLSEAQCNAIASACTYVHQSMEDMCVRYHRELRRHMYVTPKSYLNLVGTYIALLTAKRGEMSFSRQRCMTGVTKIEDSNALVGRLKVCSDVSVLQQVLTGVLSRVLASCPDLVGPPHSLFNLLRLCTSTVFVDRRRRN